MSALCCRQFQATSTLRALLLQWQSEATNPFTLVDARKWLNTYFKANGGHTSSIERFIYFVQEQGYIKIKQEKKDGRSQYFFDLAVINAVTSCNSRDPIGADMSLNKSPLSSNTRLGSSSNFSLSLKLLRRIVHELPKRTEQDMHAAMHYKNADVNATLVPLDSCSFCAHWLIKTGRYIHSLIHSKEELVSPLILAYLDFLAKWPSSEVIAKKNENMCLRSLLKQTIDVLREETVKTPSDPRTVYVIKFILQSWDRKQIHKKTMSERISVFPRRFLLTRATSRDLSERRCSGPNDISKPLSRQKRTLSLSPETFRKSWDHYDCHTEFGITRVKGISDNKPETVKFDAGPVRTLSLALALLPPNIQSILTNLIKAAHHLLAMSASKGGLNFSSSNESLPDSTILTSNLEFLVNQFAPFIFPVPPVSAQQRRQSTGDGQLVTWRENLLRILFDNPAAYIDVSDIVNAAVGDISSPTAVHVNSALSVSPPKIHEQLASVETVPQPHLTAVSLRSAFASFNIKDSTLAPPLSSIMPRCVSVDRCSLSHSNSLASSSSSVAPFDAVSVGSTEALQTRANITANLGRWRKSSQPQENIDPRDFLKLERTAELMKLLNSILEDRIMDPSLKMKYLKQFQISHGDVFWLRFGDMATANHYFDKLQLRISKKPSIIPGLTSLPKVFKPKRLKPTPKPSP